MHLRQSVTVTGLDTNSFRQVINAIRDVFVLMTLNTPPAQTIKWTPTDYLEYKAFECHCRYFTAVHLAKNETAVQFHPRVDPEGSLADMVDDKFIHIADNVVEYFTTQVEDERFVGYGFVYYIG